MSMSEWAKREVELACNRENPDWDGESFDYGCFCYQSALRAFNEMLKDGHSGFSWNATRNILERLLRSQPLTPIKESDFDDGMKSVEDDGESIQCPRMSSLFKFTDKSGKVWYHDVERVMCLTDENTFGFNSSFASRVVDEMFPIEMPYFPPRDEYKVFVKEFLTDASKGDFDTVEMRYIITPSCEKVEVNRYWTEEDGRWREIDRSEFDVLKKKAEDLMKKIESVKEYMKEKEEEQEGDAKDVD